MWAKDCPACRSSIASYVALGSRECWPDRRAVRLPGIDACLSVMLTVQGELQQLPERPTEV